MRMFEGQIERQIQQRLDPYEERVARLEKHLAALRNQVRQLTAELQQMQVRQEQTSMCGRDTADSLQPQTGVELQRAKPCRKGTSSPSVSRVCYLPAPSSDGCFDNASPTEQIGKSIYRLTTADGVNGTFVMLDSPDAIATAMISVSQFVKPVCKVVGSASVYPRTIQTVDEGSAVFENGMWRVVNKAVVKFD